MSTAIQTDNLVFAYNSRVVLNGLQLRFERGEMAALLGPNGSGKTTLLKVLSGVLRGSGDVRLGGRELRTYGRKELSRLIAVVSQESHFVFPYTVAEIVLMGRASRHGPFAFETARDLEVARRCMEATQVASLADRYMHELSGGEKQRVMIARALAQEPELLLLDEPAAFLDLKHQVHILDLMRRLHRKHGLTIIAALHDLNLAALFFPRLVMLHDGKVYRDGRAEEILNEKTIDEVYGIQVRVQRHTSGARPQVVILPSSGDST